LLKRLEPGIQLKTKSEPISKNGQRKVGNFTRSFFIVGGADITKPDKNMNTGI
jgi:hypothetical protein